MMTPAAGAAEHPLAEYFRAYGHQTISRFGALWIDVGRFTLCTIPCAMPVVATQAEIDGLLRESGRMVAVFQTAGGTGVPSPNFWIHDRGYSEASLQRQFRQQVRRARAQGGVVRGVPWDELRHCGLSVNQNTMRRRGVKQSACATPEGWAAICTAADRVPGLEATGCFLGDLLAGFIISWTHEGLCHGVSLNRDERFNAQGAGNLLAFGFVRLVMARPEVRSLAFGRGWFPPEASIDRFKRHAGFVDEPIPLAVTIHPRWAGVLGSGLTHALLHGLDRLSGRRLNLAADLEVLQAAGVTRLPDRPAGG